MNQSISTKIFSFGVAAMVTLTIMVSLDALATTEQRAALAAGYSTQTACVSPSAALPL